MTKPAPKNANSKPRAPRSFKLDPQDLENLNEQLDAKPEPEAHLPATTHSPLPARKSRAGRWILVGITGLLSLSFALAIDELIRALFTRYEWLGYAGLALLAILTLGLIGFIIGETRALSRLARIDSLRRHVAAANTNGSEQEMRRALNDLQRLYAERADTAAGRARLASHLDEVMDASDLAKLAEREVLTPLDNAARQAILSSSKRVSLVTALSPRALVDLGIVFYECLRLISAIARLYGARPGSLGYWRLARKVATHLALTGGMAAGDTVLEQFIGQGLAARLSARLGEGVINGFLTSRVGLAAVEVCRPMPFIESKGITLPQLMGELAKSTRPAKEKDEANATQEPLDKG
ncbi:YcjF family protein [Polycladidibacter hongkongensis]|uniref:YcjF family protein n=1 Tax=Polycladidibacter hongkongensis TaxID=1647556 RepID=UPI00083261D3|nr:TIGR01620 family protein [Pseudovibrio hongkongensis]